MKKLFTGCMLAALGLGTTAAREVADTKLPFESSPAVVTDDKGEFTRCGFVMTAERAATSRTPGVRFAIKIISSVKGEYGVVSAIEESSINTSAWAPTPKLLQWIRIGDANPVVMNPYDVITQKNRGMSTFTTAQDPTKAVYLQLEKRQVPVFVKFTHNEDFIYSGTLRVAEGTLAQMRQCFKTLR